MCIIVDANAAHRLKVADSAGVLVLKWLRSIGKLVSSSALIGELPKAGLLPFILELQRNGKLVRVNDEECESLAQKLRISGVLRSNDAHVVALAALTRCETVFTHDIALHTDLKNRDILKHKCGIFQYAEHSSLLKDCRC